MAVDRVRDNTIVILDTNSLFMPFQFKLNLDSELKRLLGDYQLVIPSSVIFELQHLRDREKFGPLALKLAQSIAQPSWFAKFESALLSQQQAVLDSNDARKADSVIIRLAKELNAIVLTNDKLLLSLLKENDIRTISLKGRKYLVINHEP